MSCENNVCGTGLGGGNVSKPGDPDNNVSLSARTVYGGISVSWSFPTTNPNAVAHTIIYRGTTDDFASAIEQAKAGGSVYFDSLNPTVDTTYWYWIRIRSINGTLADRIGPVSATAKSRSQQTAEELTGLIDAGVLSQELKTYISGISLQGQILTQEIEARINANTELSGLIAAVQSGQLESMTYIQQEITQRATADSAIVSTINTMAAAVASNTAAILTESQVRADKDSAMATQITTLFSKTDTNTAAIQNEVTTRTNQNSAMASSVSTLNSRVGSAESTLVTEQIVRASADASLASRITSAESSLFGNVATGQVALQTQINSQNGKITSIGALYTAKLQVNGLIGGFGVYNDGTIVEAGFDVDRFWIGRTGPDKVKPFIIDSGIVYIDKARIRNADIDTLKIAGNAVTIPAFSSGYGGTPVIGFNEYYTISTMTVYYPQPVSIAVIANWQSGLGNEGANANMRVLVNGVVRLDWKDSGIANYTTSHVGAGSLNLPAGLYTIHVQVYNDYFGGGWYLGNWSALLLGTMR